MTKYKTNADKLRFFREAREARMPKAKQGLITAPTTKGMISYPKPHPLEPQGPNLDFMYTNTTQGELPSRNPTTMYTNTTKGEIAPTSKKSQYKRK